MSHDPYNPPADDIHELIERWRSTVGKRHLRVLAPIYREGVRAPELIGTGVLVTLGTRTFLLSAGHVSDDIRDGPHYFAGAGRLLTLPPWRYSSPIPQGGTRDDDSVDLAYWVVPDEVAQELEPGGTLQAEQLDLVPAEHQEQSVFCLTGFPHSRQPRSLKDGQWDLNPFLFLTVELSDHGYGQVGRDRESAVVVEFNKSAVFKRGQKIQGPNLHGVSGGALWRISGLGASADRPVLSAIVTTWRKAQPPSVIGARLFEWLRVIALDHPAEFAALRTRVLWRAV